MCLLERLIFQAPSLMLCPDSPQILPCEDGSGCSTLILWPDHTGARFSEAEAVLASFFPLFLSLCFLFPFLSFRYFPFPFSFSSLSFIFSFYPSFPSHVSLAFTLSSLSVLNAPVHVFQALRRPMASLPTRTVTPR